jgi:aldehyde:ferredoxin oxidoreductase
MDAMGMCNFVRYSVQNDMQPLLDLVRFRYGVEISEEGFDDIVKETLRIEHLFNSDAGIAAMNYRFCESFYEEAQPETGEKMDITDKESAQARKW